MAANPPFKPPISGYKNQLEPDRACAFAPREIFNWLARAAKSPRRFGGEENNRPVLIEILKEIMRLCPRVDNLDEAAEYEQEFGKQYQRRGLGLDQYIYRVPNKEDTPPPPKWPWDATKKRPSLIDVGKYPHSSTHSSGFPLTYAYWSPYDLLGLFLSILAPPPPAASPERWFIPLTVVYARWCLAIAPSGVNIGTMPAFFQCTYEKKKEAAFFLGATTAGYAFEHDRDGKQVPWARVLKYRRFQLLDKLNLVLDFDRSPVRHESARQRAGENATPEEIQKEETSVNNTRQRFGNCAETYPYLHILGRGRKEANDKNYGIVLRRACAQKDLRPEMPDDPPNTLYYPWEEIAADIGEPCENCEYLIQSLGANPEHFK